MNRPPFDKLGMCEAERAMLEAVRRDRRIIVGLIVVMMAGYVALSFFGGTGL